MQQNKQKKEVKVRAVIKLIFSLGTYSLSPELSFVVVV